MNRPEDTNEHSMAPYVDAARAQILRAVMRQLREHSDGLWSEIASGVLGGSVTLRQIAEASAYRDAFARQGDTLSAWRDEVGQETFEDLGRQAEAVVDELAYRLWREAGGSEGNG